MEIVIRSFEGEFGLGVGKWVSSGGDVEFEGFAGYLSGGRFLVLERSLD